VLGISGLFGDPAHISCLGGPRFGSSHQQLGRTKPIPFCDNRARLIVAAFEFGRVLIILRRPRSVGPRSWAVDAFGKVAK
jgi:hypothetical protein